MFVCPLLCPVPKISQVMMKHEISPPSFTSRLVSVDLLCGTTAAELHNTVSLMHAPGVAYSDEPC